MRIRLHPQAKVDLESTAKWYLESAGRDVAADIIEAYSRTAELILEHPEMGRAGIKDTRSIAFRRFPYSLAYKADDEGILVVAIAHWRKLPAVWTERR